MFGISFVEFLIIICVVVFLVGPNEIPDLARNVMKLFYKIKHFIAESKKELKAVGDEMGLDEIKNEVEREIILEKKKLENEVMTIVDIHGNEHQVFDVGELRGDLSREELEAEINKHNKINNKQDE
jgi:Sec-independent protein translocase protein TatA